MVKGLWLRVVQGCRKFRVSQVQALGKPSDRGCLEATPGHRGVVHHGTFLNSRASGNIPRYVVFSRISMLLRTTPH